MTMDSDGGIGGALVHMHPLVSDKGCTIPKVTPHSTQTVDVYRVHFIYFSCFSQMQYRVCTSVCDVNVGCALISLPLTHFHPAT